MLRIILILLASLSLEGCSSRVVFDRPASPSAPYAININSASVHELEKLPHIGRKTAESIFQFREANGLFHRPEQVMLIRGMSEARFFEIRDLIRTE